MLLEELAVVEEEIVLLETKVKELKLQLYAEREQSREWEIHLRRVCKHNQFPRVSRYGSMINEQRYRSHNFEVFTDGRITTDRRASLSSALDIHSLFTTQRRSNGNTFSSSKMHGSELMMQCTLFFSFG